MSQPSADFPAECAAGLLVLCLGGVAAALGAFAIDAFAKARLRREREQAENDPEREP